MRGWRIENKRCVMVHVRVPVKEDESLNFICFYIPTCRLLFLFFLLLYEGPRGVPYEESGVCIVRYDVMCLSEL